MRKVRLFDGIARNGLPGADLERISRGIIKFQIQDPEDSFRGFNLIDKDFSWNEFCFMMNCDRGAASEVWATAKAGLIGDELLATR